MMSKSTHNSVERSPVLQKEDDPLNFNGGDVRESLSRATAVADSWDERESYGVKRESLTIRLEDENRIVDALHNAAKKQTTGSMYSLKIDISKSGTLGIGMIYYHHQFCLLS